MEITTVKVKKKTKSALDEIRENAETYDEVIVKLLACAKQKAFKKNLIEAYKKMGKQDLDLLREWDPASQEV